MIVKVATSRRQRGHGVRTHMIIKPTGIFYINTEAITMTNTVLNVLSLHVVQYAKLNFTEVEAQNT